MEEEGEVQAFFSGIIKKAAQGHMQKEGESREGKNRA